MTTTIKRRALGAAGVVAIGASAVAFSAANAPAASAATATVNYKCAVTSLGLPAFKDPWVAKISVDLPAQANINSSLASPKVTAQVTVGDDAAAQLRALNVKTVEGTAVSEYTVAGDVVKPGARTADLSIPVTPIPASGPVVNVASGNGASETAGATAGTAKIAVGSFTTYLTTDSGFKLTISCDVIGSGSIGGVTIVDPSAPSSSPSSPSSSSSSSSAPSSSTTMPSSTTTMPTSTTTGPPVITDGGSGDGSANTVVGAGAVAAVVGAGFGAFGLRRRMKR